MTSQIALKPTNILSGHDFVGKPIFLKVSFKLEKYWGYTNG
jgi:hypothetical protein